MAARWFDPKEETPVQRYVRRRLDQAWNIRWSSIALGWDVSPLPDPNPMPRIHLFRWSRRRAA